MALTDPEILDDGCGIGCCGGRFEKRYTLWRWTGKYWALHKAPSDPAYKPGPEPRYPGKYVGELLRTPSVPAKP